MLTPAFTSEDHAIIGTVVVGLDIPIETARFSALYHEHCENILTIVRELDFNKVLVILWMFYFISFFFF
jgi:hypothetical protein